MEFEEAFNEIFCKGKEDFDDNKEPQSDNDAYLDGYGEAYAEAEIIAGGIYD